MKARSLRSGDTGFANPRTALARAFVRTKGQRPKQLSSGMSAAAAMNVTDPGVYRQSTAR